MAESSTHLTDDASSSPPQEQPSSPPVVLSTSKPTDEKDPSARFRGDGTSFKAKIIGIDDVPESRGDKMCQESILKLKAIVKASGQHKQKIVINVSLSGLKIINLMTAQVMHEHRVDRISFIARDLTDRRAFGYVVGTEEGKHQFFAIKTAKAAEQVVLSLRDLFQVVYDMKKKEMEVAKQKVEDTPSEAVYAVPNNRPVKQPQSNPAQPEGNISTLQKELDNIHQISNSDAFKNPFPENTPTSPNTPGASHEGDLFGMSLPSTNATQPNFSADLAELSIEGLEPAPGGGAKLTKQEILSGFGQGSSGMFQQQQPNFFTGQQQSAYFPQQQQQQPAYGIPPQPAPRSINAPAHNPFGGGFGAVPQPQTTTMGMFPSGPSPVIPSRPAPMKPPITTPVQAAPSQNPFGDAFGNAAPSNDVLAPVNSQPSLVNGSAANGEMASDPFASLIPGMGSGATDKNDMFKDFQIAKPPQPPPRSNDSVSAYFDDYFRKSVGGVPLDEASNAANVSGQASKPSNDPFAMFSSTDTDQTFNFNGQATYNGPSLLG